jgi:hypothetical protein
MLNFLIPFFSILKERWRTLRKRPNSNNQLIKNYIEVKLNKVSAPHKHDI